MSIVIAGIGSFAPERVMSNDELSTLVDTSDEWIYSHTGIKNRHIAKPDEAASDLGAKAAVKALKDAGMEPSAVDLLICATSTPDYPSFPATACIIQEKIGAENAAAFDITAACSGFPYGIEIARAFIRSGQAKTVLLVGAEVYSKVLNWKDRNTCVLFGDGAGAVLLTSSSDESRGILDGMIGSNGRDATCLLRPAGGSRQPFIPGQTPPEDLYISMDGKKVYLFAVNVVGKLIEKLMERNGLTPETLDWVVPHQANVRIIEAAAKRIGLPMSKFFLNMDEYANTSAASIPLALCDMQNKNLLKRGQKIITVGFGAGLTQGGNYIVW